MAGVKAQPLICVADVEASSSFYQTLLGATSGHGGSEYERVMSGDGFVLQLHDWDAHDHAHLGDPGRTPYGNGVLLWFEVDDLDAAARRAAALGAEILEALHDNPRAGHRELWLRDPDGYTLVLASVPGR
jgi:predicted enzyme related to lactoylglutathione lyase